MKIHLVQLEPLKERYTEWWATYIPEKLRAIGVEVNIIEGETLTSSVESGTVLDACGTNYYKSSQMQKIAKMFHSGSIKPLDRFLIADIWFPGIEAIKYMSDLKKIPVKIYGVWHAGSITDGDFMQPSHGWAKFFEMGFLTICDGIFVGSDYSAHSIITRLLSFVTEEDGKQIARNIHAQGMPLDYKMLDSINEPKKPIILFPHRFDTEKQPNIFLDAIEVVAKRYNPSTPIEFCFCTSRETLTSNAQWLLDKLSYLQNSLDGLHEHNYFITVRHDLSKKAYYELLSSSLCMVSTTIEENFGYCLVEALALGTMPIVPNAFSHPEILDGHEEYMYETFDELTAKMIDVIKLWELRQTDKLEEIKPELKKFVSPYDDTVESWAKIMN